MTVRSNQYVGESYAKYFYTPHWHHLKQSLIYSNPRARCYICEKKNTLLIHHENYDNLFKEKYGKDVFILCFDCHSSLHKYKLFGIFKRTTKLKPYKLKQQRLTMRCNYLIRNNRYGLATLYLLRSIIGI